jgi:hypothetical protein
LLESNKYTDWLQFVYWLEGYGVIKYCSIFFLPFYFLLNMYIFSQSDVETVSNWKQFWFEPQMYKGF